MEKSPEELYAERTQRVEAAIRLQVPDRVPIMMRPGFFPAKYAGITCEDAFYDFGKWMAAVRKTILDFAPDMFHASAGNLPGGLLEVLDNKQIKWPGHGVPANHTFQFVEGEYMKADEYDAFLDDPSDYVLRTLLPRNNGALEALRMLPPLRSMMFGYGALMSTRVLTRPELTAAFEALGKAGREASRWQAETGAFGTEMAGLGFPQSYTAVSTAPFDVISDHLRGMRGSMLDMYRQPDNLLAACEKILPMSIERGVSAAKRSGNPRVFIPLHRGADGFMSSKQFEIFYWPTLKRLMLALIDEGLTPYPFFEGDYTSRLEYLLELPKGKVLGQFGQVDMARVKEILGDTMCLRGNVPSSLLQTGTPQDVIDYCKRLIDVAGKGGGFIMSHESALDEVKPENLKAMIDFTKEYGVYQ
ncbi:MAG: uroporphyrinogen decarboxylase family protein [Desulfobacterales bacterium]|nr:uroporphyrinogen decarboxylase family protein [Desulfobacterales bacterium]